MKIGDKKNRWTYIRESEKPYYGWFRCDCGTVKENYIWRIEKGLSKSCGCYRTELKQQKADKKYIGKRYGRLTIIEIIRKNNTLTHFRCKCDCGNETVVPNTSLLRKRGNVSCGCYKKELARESVKLLIKEAEKAREKYSYDGTNVTMLNQKLSKNSTTGIKGVSQRKDGKYIAYISLKGKQQNLGVFATLEESAQARADAEKEYYEPVIEEWNERNLKD